MQEFLRDLLTPAAAIAAMLGAVAGALLDNWLALGRERRSAFHGICQKLRVELFNGPNVERLDGADIDLYCRLAPRGKARRFRRALAEHEQAKKRAKRRTETGATWYEQTPELVAAREKLLRLTEWR